MSNVNYEVINQNVLFGEPPVWERTEIEKSIQFVLKQIDRNLESFTNQFPDAASIDNVYPAIDNIEWTSGFWTGMLWLAYEVTGDEKYRRTADIQLESYRERAEKRLYTDTHDLGFLYTLSCVSSYKLTGNVEAKRVALLAADLLMERYVEKAGIVQAWGSLDDPDQQGRMIIDCNLNLPLLYWSTEVTGNPKYADAAKQHISQAAKYIVREDASTFHTYYIDVRTGEPKHGCTHQGYADDSCWARGQAWGMYGFPLSYIYNGDVTLLELTKKLSNYYLNRLPEDLIAYWDLSFTSGTEQERDTSTGAIAVCGMLELAKHLPILDSERMLYMNAALHTIKRLSDHYTTAFVAESNGFLLHGVYNKPRGMGIDECNIWGDYFYFEALVRITSDWELYW